MTAVMRAMTQQTGPKVLRIGLVTGGRIVEERIVKQRTTVTVGQSEKAMFVIQAPSLPPQFKLFELVGGEYYLNFRDGMSGRVALQTGITDLAALRGQARRTNDGSYQVKLTDDARGKIVIGDTTFLFQFVAPPPVQPRPQLPLSVKAGNQIDWRLVTICAFTFLFHFAPILFLFSDWNDRPLVGDTGATVSLMDPRCSGDQCPIKPPQVVEQQDNGQPAPDNSQSNTPKPAAKPQGGPAAKGPSGPPASGDSSAVADQARALLLRNLLALGAGPGSAVASGDRGSSIIGDVSKQASQADNVGGEGGPLGRGSGNGAVVPGGNKDTTGVVGGQTGGGNVDTAGTATQTHVTGVVNAGGVANPGRLSNAEAVFRGQIAAAARACYQRALANNPNLQGTVSLTVVVGPSGEAKSASASGMPEVASCVQAAAYRANYGAVQGGGTATVSGSFSFIAQH